MYVLFEMWLSPLFLRSIMVLMLHSSEYESLLLLLLWSSFTKVFVAWHE